MFPRIVLLGGPKLIGRYVLGFLWKSRCVLTIVRCPHQSMRWRLAPLGNREFSGSSYVNLTFGGIAAPVFRPQRVARPSAATLLLGGPHGYRAKC